MENMINLMSSRFNHTASITGWEDTMSFTAARNCRG
jgi:hypothetical protein